MRRKTYSAKSWSGQRNKFSARMRSVHSLKLCNYHRPSWMAIVLAVAVAIFLIYASFAGNITDRGGAFAGGTSVSWEKYEHGWPTVFLTREVINKPSTRFRLLDGSANVDLWKLALNLLSVALIEIIVFAGIEWHLKRNSQIWRFTILELLILISIVGSILGYGRYVTRRSSRELQLGEKLGQLGHSCAYKYCGPLILARVFGERIHANAFHGISKIILAEHCNDQTVKEVCELVGYLHCCDAIDARQTNTSDSGLAYLAELPWSDNVRSLRLDDTQVTGSGLSSLTHFPHLRHLTISYTRLGDSAIESISKCQDLEELNCDGTAITEACIPTLYQFRALKRLTAFDTEVPESKWKEFATKSGCHVEF